MTSVIKRSSVWCGDPTHWLLPSKAGVRAEPNAKGGGGEKRAGDTHAQLVPDRLPPLSNVD